MCGHIVGFPNNRTKRTNTEGVEVVTIAPVRPLRYIRDDKSQLPKENRLRKVFADDWRPVLKVMNEKAKHLIRNTDCKDMDSVFIEATFAAGRQGLQEKYPSLFAGRKLDKGRQWRVATWSKKVNEENRRQRNEGI